MAANGKQRVIGNNSFPKFNIGNCMHHILTVYKKDMAEAKLGWVLFHLLGFPVSITAYLADIDYIQMGEPWKSIFLCLGLCYITVTVLRAHNKWRKENEEFKQTRWENEQKRKSK